MNKVLAITCTVSFTVFWVFCGLSVLAWVNKHVLFSALAVIALLGLALGVWTRLRLAELTRELPYGGAVAQPKASARG